MSVMTLYNSDMSPFSTRVRIQIRAKGLENQIAIVDRPDLETFRAINPTGKVPCLDTGSGFHLPESETIAEFIEDSYPEPPLRGHTALGKAKVRLLSRLTDLDLIPVLQVLFNNVAPANRELPVTQEALAALGRVLDLLDKYIEGPVYALEGRMTLADCALGPGLFFAGAITQMMQQPTFLGRERVKSYINHLIRDDAHVNRAIAEVQAGFSKMLAAREAAKQG